MKERMEIEYWAYGEIDELVRCVGTTVETLADDIRRVESELSAAGLHWDRRVIAGSLRKADPVEPEAPKAEPEAPKGKTIRTADGATLKQGDRAFNYYDCKWGVIEQINTHDEWFTFRHDDKTSACLNGERISTTKPHWMR